MRIALYGNICNNFFAIARAVRSTSDIDAHLFIDEDADWTQLPESEAPELRAGYPPWIHKGPYGSALSRLWPGASPLVRELAGFDVLLASAAGIRLAPFVPCPVIFYVTGWDLTVAPFPIRFQQRYQRPAEKAAALLGGIWQRRGISAATRIWSQPFAPFEHAAARLGIRRDRLEAKYFPLMVDTDLFRPVPNPPATDDPLIRRIVNNHDFVVFHPSRMMLSQSRGFVETGTWKGNDRLFEGFAMFLREHPDARPVLVLVERAGSSDTPRAKELISRLGIADHVLWLGGSRSRGFDRVDLVALYAAADVVADEFGVGWFGSVVIEATAMGKPVMCHVDQDVMKQLYPWHPILSLRTPEQIAASLTDLWRHPEQRKRLGDLGRRWALEFHSIDRACASYVQSIRELAETLGTGG